MVCETCTKKLTKIVVGDKWKSGANNTVQSGIKLNDNKALSSKKKVFFTICRICKSKVHQKGCHYCQDCAFKKSICGMCGKKLMNNKAYSNSSA